MIVQNVQQYFHLEQGKRVSKNKRNPKDDVFHLSSIERR